MGRARTSFAIRAGCSVPFTGAMKNHIKEFRTKRGMTQEDLADAAGIRRETIVFLEQGKYNPSLLLAHRVAKSLKTKIEALFEFEKSD
jgi:putative transcriptional regulator